MLHLSVHTMKAGWFVSCLGDYYFMVECYQRVTPKRATCWHGWSNFKQKRKKKEKNTQKTLLKLSQTYFTPKTLVEMCTNCLRKTFHFCVTWCWNCQIFNDFVLHLKVFLELKLQILVTFSATLPDFESIITLQKMRFGLWKLSNVGEYIEHQFF